MLTSFFGNSKPVHFLVLGGFLALGFFWTVFFGSVDSQGATSFFDQILVLAATILSIIVLDFIVSRNQLTRRNSFSIFFYTCFLAMMPIVFLHTEMLWANFFLLLALRRLISLRKESNSEKKILDAAIWITVASLFYFWSLLYFIPLLIAIVQKPNLTYKQMLVPFVGFFAVLVINTALQILRAGTFVWFFDWHHPVVLDFSVYSSPRALVPATLLLTLVVFSLGSTLRKFNSVSLKGKSGYMLLFIVIAISLILSVFGTDNDGARMVFMFAPTAILCANYIEDSGKREFGSRARFQFWIKEILLWIVMLLAIVLLFI